MTDPDLYCVPWFTRALAGAAGSALEIVRSRRSRSTYLYLAPADGEGDRVSLRISDHRNPAENPMRVSSENDRSELTDFEWRCDLRRGFGPGLTDDCDWREIAALMLAQAGYAIPAKLDREVAAIAAGRVEKARREAAAKIARDAYYASAEHAAKVARDIAAWKLHEDIEAEARRLCEADGNAFDGKNNRERRNRYRAAARAALVTA